MDDAELIENFIRQEVAGDAVHILVCQIRWKGACDPWDEWTVAAKLRRNAPPETLDAAIASILRDGRYFGVCKDCGERQPQGWMQSDDMCQGCAAKHGGVF